MWRRKREWEWEYIKKMMEKKNLFLYYTTVCGTNPRVYNSTFVA